MTHDTTTAGECGFCWRPSDIGGHNEGCPVHIGTPEAETEWERGYQYGWSDNYIQWWLLPNYPKTFVLGYRVGRATIEAAMDAAHQSNYALSL